MAGKGWQKRKIKKGFNLEKEDDIMTIGGYVYLKNLTADRTYVYFNLRIKEGLLK